jgi:hypothetical protein
VPGTGRAGHCRRWRRPSLPRWSPSRALIPARPGVNAAAIALLAACLAVILAPAALSPNLLVLALLIGLAEVLVSPALATAYVLADSLASPTARTHAGNWVNSGYNAGSSAGPRCPATGRADPLERLPPGTNLAVPC